MSARAMSERRHYPLRACPPGLFLFGGTLGFKTQYGATVGGKVTSHAEAFIASNGEAFWGGTSRRADRDQLLVVPVTLADLSEPDDLDVIRIPTGDA